MTHGNSVYPYLLQNSLYFAKVAALMKKEIHPQNYRKVLFIDNSNDSEFLISSTVQTSETGKAKDGKEYPIYRVEISSSSHPFYTGNEKSLDTAGRAEKFRARVAKAKAGK